MFRHVPVLLAETLEHLAPREGETFVDCTAGLGGHAAAVAARLGTAGRAVLSDADGGNLAAAVARVREVSGPAEVVPIHGNFADLPRALAERGVRADMVLADLGFASSQMDDAARGLSFQRDGPLDMRFDPTSPVTAEELVATLPEAELARLIGEFGEERHAARIARKLVAARGAEPISTTARLAHLVRQAVPASPVGIDPSTRTFQALRIAVNDELGSLHSLLASITRAAAGSGAPFLAAGARVAMISFHSLEDRPIKHTFAGLVHEGRAEHLTRRPVTPGHAEVAANPRSRSAKLRVIRLLF